MIISVASGKGGTGKTTIATSLAAVLGSKAQLLDCDVEEPNCHILTKPDSGDFAKSLLYRCLSWTEINAPCAANVEKSAYSRPLL